MIEVGSLDQFGFLIGPTPRDKELHDVSIFIGGKDMTCGDNVAYLPSFIGELAATSECLKSRIDYLKYAQLFRKMNVSQIHNAILHGSTDCFRDDREWDTVAQAHRFGDWGETTDGFAAFLIPYVDQLYLTSQSCETAAGGYRVLDVIDGVKTTPYYLITTIDEAIQVLMLRP